MSCLHLHHRPTAAALPAVALALLLVSAAGCAVDDAPPVTEAEAGSDTPVGDSADADPYRGPFHPSLDHLERGTVTLTRSEDDHVVEIAVTVPDGDEQFREGLMGVPELAHGTGMLFDFGRERQGAFWMKDTLVPLDIAFAGSDGEVLSVLAMAPCEADPCPDYDPGVDYRYALEVPHGWFDANRLGPGDHLGFTPPG